MKDKNKIRIVIGIITLIVLVVGLTFAYLSWKSDNVNIAGNSGCFDIVYDKGQDIGSIDSPYGLMPTCNYSDGASAMVTINIDPNCTTTGRASINLHTNSFTLYDGTDAFAIGSQNILKYQVTVTGTDGETTIDGCSGYITNSNTTISLCEVDLTTTPTKYTVYLYLDCDTVTTTYIGSSYSGYIQSVAYQTVS